MFNLTSENLTVQRNNYVSAMLESLVNQVAQDLVAGDTGREVAIPALCRIVSGTLPNTGKGHADNIKAQVNDAVDAAIAAMSQETEEAEQETEEAAKETKGKAA